MFFIENDPLYFGDPNYQEYSIEINEIITIHCFSHSNDPVNSYVDGTLFGRSMAPEFGIKVNSEILTVWSRPSSSSEISSHSPFNKRSWIYNSEKKPIDCGTSSDNGGNIQFNITNSDLSIN